MARARCASEVHIYSCPHANVVLVEANKKSFFCLIQAVGKWAQALSTQTGCGLYLVCGLAGVLLQVPRGTLGLVLVYAGILQRSGMDLMMGLTWLESSFVSVERVASFLRIAPEADLGRGSMPKDGSIEFEKVDFRYRPSRPLVLRNVSLKIASGSKVAVCGRTGSGKSSLLALITRLYPVSKGIVRVGGVDAKDICLKDLRSFVGVVGQTPILSGTCLREALGLGNDQEEAIKALQRVGLTQDRFKNLDAPIGPGGSFFSLGERQLVVLARVLAKNPGIILCDEATASLDPVADELVHNILLRLGCTVISILHRLDFIPRFDYVIEMAEGRVISVEQNQKS